jgi:hypothetical protein
VTRRYNTTFEHLMADALDPTESIRMLGNVQDELQQSRRS